MVVVSSRSSIHTSRRFARRRRRPESAKELHSILLGPLRTDVSKTRLIVVPDGKLHLLPFDALINEKGDYVLKSHVVTYAPSATVLHLLKTQPANRATNVPLLAIGDVPYGDGRNLIASNSWAW